MVALRLVSCRLLLLLLTDGYGLQRDHMDGGLVAGGRLHDVGMEHSGNVLGTFGEHSGNIQGTFSGRSVSINVVRLY